MLRSRLGPQELRLLRRVGAGSDRAFLVGGIIRDLALGRESHDLDVAVEGDVAALARGLGGELRIHPAFATATIEFESGVRLDLAATRIESYAAPAALPRIRPASIEQDLWRRDFTINAMAVRLTRTGLGALLDPCGGLHDLRKRRLRVMHGLSFIDDPTRAFRAVRFAAELGFKIAPRTEASLRLAARVDLFSRLSSARLRRELRLIFEGLRPGDALRLMRRLGIWRTGLPPINLPDAIHAQLNRVSSVVQRFANGGTGESVSRWIVSLGLLLRETSAARVDRFLDRLQPSRRERSLLRKAPADLRRIESRLAVSRRLKASEIFGACRELPTETLLMVAMAAPSLPARRRVRSYLERLRGISTAIDGTDHTGFISHRHSNRDRARPSRHPDERSRRDTVPEKAVRQQSHRHSVARGARGSTNGSRALITAAQTS